MAHKQDPVEDCASTAAPIQHVSLRFRIENNALEISAHSRLVTAVDRLLGGLIDLPGSFVAGLNSRRRLREHEKTETLTHEQSLSKLNRHSQLAIAETRSRALVAAAVQEITCSGVESAQLLVESDTQNMFLADFVRDRAKKTGNKFAIVSEAIEILDAEAVTTGTGDAGPNPSSETAQIGEDWLNIFSDHAERASSDELRSLWAKVLSGEIRKPGSFSPRTLRFIAELDSQIADAFEKISGFIVANSVPRQQNISGEELDNLLILEEAGLISNAGMPLSKQFRTDDTGRVAIVRNNSVLAIQSAPNIIISFPNSPLTKVGIEVLSILPPTSDDDALTNLATFFQGTPSIDRIVLAEIAMRTPDRLWWNDKKELWRKPTNP